MSVALFVFGTGFVIVGARASKQAPAIQPAVTTPVASVKRIMNGIVSPASTVIFNAVSTTVTAKGIEDVAPRNDEEWAAVGNSAAALAEAGNLMMLDGRAIDRGDWITMSKAMLEGGPHLAEGRRGEKHRRSPRGRHLRQLPSAAPTELRSAMTHTTHDAQRAILGRPELARFAVGLRHSPGRCWRFRCSESGLVHTKFSRER